MSHYPNRPDSLIKSSARKSTRVSLAVTSMLLSVLASAQTRPPSLRIVVVEGEGAINNVLQHRAKDPVVRVVDENDGPVTGATVTFMLPDSGASGEFGGGVRTLTILTDENGEAVGRGLVPNQAAGNFQIRVVASAHGEMADMVINQTNAEPAGARGHSKKFLLIALIGGGAAAGAALAARGGGATQPPTNNPPPIVITTGTPAIQPPH
jgi:hypothetical protein